MCKKISFRALRIIAAECVLFLAAAALFACVPLADNMPAQTGTTADGGQMPSSFPTFDASQYAAVPGANVDYDDARAVSILSQALGDTSLSLQFMDPKLTADGLYCIEADNGDGSVYGYYHVDVTSGAIYMASSPDGSYRQVGAPVSQAASY